MKITIELDTTEPRVAELAETFLQLLAAAKAPQKPQTGTWIFEGPGAGIMDSDNITPTHQPAPETTTEHNSVTVTIPKNTPATTTWPTGSVVSSATISAEALPTKPTQPVEVSPQQTFTAEANTHTLEEVRATLAALNKAGKRAQVKALLQEFGTEKLTEVNPDDFPALMKKAATL